MITMKIVTIVEKKKKQSNVSRITLDLPQFDFRFFNKKVYNKSDK